MLPLALSLAMRLQATRLSGVLVSGVGLAVLTGWALGLEPVKRVIPGFVAMNPTTALAFVLLGVALVLHGRREPWAGPVASGFGVAAAMIGAVKLLGLIGGVDTGIDRLLFREGLEAYATPNRMAPNTALNFTLLGASLALLRARSRSAVVAGQALAATSMVIALLVLLGYAYGVRQLQGLTAFIPMAVHTAATFLVAGAAALALRPREGFVAFITAQNAGGQIARRLLPFAILLPAGLGYLRLRGEQAGLYSAEFGVALFAATMVVVFSVVIVSHARTAGRADEARLNAEEEARAALKAAQEATAAKSNFLANMSHEIRTPLNGVIGMTDLLMETRLDEQQREYATTIQTSGEHLLTIISDILDLSKIEAGKLELEHQPVDVRELGERALDIVAPAAAQKDIEVAFLVDGSVPSAILGDVVRLRQVLVNLLSNAIKFTSAGEVVLSARAEPMEDRAVKLHFTVMDTGSGIPADRLPRLFQAFTQGDASMTRLHGGTGLGLAISRRLVEAMGGHIGVKSQVGEGSEFFFHIVAPRADLPNATPLHSVPRLMGRRVLVVDDNPTNRRVLQDNLRAWGMVPSPTGSPLEALEWIREGREFDAAIVDHLMPEMDGEVLSKEIARIRTADLPIVLATSLGTTPHGNYAAVITKPIKASALFDTLISLFAREPGQVEARRVHPAAKGSRSLRILLVEDNIVNQKVALLMLKRLGHDADVASNGVEAVQRATSSVYDVIFMDLQMPEMDGLEATKQIRAALGSPRPRIIALTAHALAGERERCIAAGMDDHISKPIDAERLATVLAEAEAEA